MSHPPNAYRRRKLRRRVALALLALVLAAGGTGYAYWRDTRFPARSEPLRGTPIDLRVQAGVTASELRVIRVGLRLTDRFMARSLGRSVTRHVEARIARTNGCRPFQKAGEALIGEAQAGFMCIDTASPAWQWMMLKDRPAATAAAGHEYVHVLQGELGCLRGNFAEDYRWLKEGMAEEISWQALVAAQRVSRLRVTREIRGSGAFDPNLEPLRRYEIDGGRDPEYALWHVAVMRLVRLAVAAGLAPAGRPEISLKRFCDRVGAGSQWRAAFARSFGLTTDSFYARFERGRKVDRLKFGG